ncbi:MAG TPA: glycosyltransferase family 39 protein [Methylomirabilota bacterium]|nr:glycosyltransferase family 39 protein [Methylomirabilota bacterium]
MAGTDVSWSRAGWAAALLAMMLAAALLLPGLGRVPFDDPGEGQHAEIAREVWSTGDWLTLRLNGVRYFDKPPALYWLTAGAFSVFGPSEWAARLVPLLAGLLAVAGTALLGARLLGASGGFAAGAALLSCALFAAFARYLRPETLFVATIQWGFAGLLLAGLETHRRRRWALLGCVGLGLASLAKDPLGLVGPLLAVGLVRAFAGRLRPIGDWLPAGGIALLAVVGGGWYVLANVREPGYLWYTVVDNHVLNVARLRHFPDEDVPLTALEFAVASGFGAFPWILSAGWATVSLLRRRAWRDPGEIPWVTLALWAVGLLAVVSLSPFRLPHYGLAAYPAIALLACRAWQERQERARGLIGWHLGAFATLAVACALATSSDGRLFTEAVLGVTDVYARKEAALGQAVPAPPWGELRGLVALAAAVFAAASVALAWSLVRGAGRLGFSVVLLASLGLVPVVTSALSLVTAARSVAPMAVEVRRHLGPHDLLVHEGPIENSGALEFYSGRRPFLLDATRSVLGFGATFPDAGGIFWSPDRLRQEAAAGRRILLVTPRAPERSLVAFEPPERLQPLLVANGRWLYDLRPGQGVGYRDGKPMRSTAASRTSR